MKGRQPHAHLPSPRRESNQASRALTAYAFGSAMFAFVALGVGIANTITEFAAPWVSFLAFLVTVSALLSALSAFRTQFKDVPDRQSYEPSAKRSVLELSLIVGVTVLCMALGLSAIELLPVLVAATGVVVVLEVAYGRMNNGKN